MSNQNANTTGPSFRKWSVRGIAALGAGLLLTTAACSAGGSDTDANAPVEEINLLTWAGFHEDEWLEEYTQETGVTVNVQYITSVADAFAKVKANPEGFDIVMGTSGFVENYVDADLIVPFDLSKVPNVSNLSADLDWQGPVTYKDELWGLGYSWGSVMLAWNEDNIPEGLDSWDSLWDPQYAGRVSIIDDPITTLPTLALGMGIQDPEAMVPGDENWDGFSERVLELRSQINRAPATFEEQTADFVSGQVYMGLHTSMDSFNKAVASGAPLKATIPDTGTGGWTDSYIITKAGAAKGDAVYDFIDYTTSIPWLARFTAETGYSPFLSTETAQSDEAIEVGLTPEIFATTQLGMAADDPELLGRIVFSTRMADVDAWLNLWTEVKLS